MRHFFNEIESENKAEIQWYILHWLTDTTIAKSVNNDGGFKI